jgi:DNA replication protein DnaC
VSHPERLTPDEALAGLRASAGRPERQRMRDANDLSPEEAAELARAQAARASLMARGRALAERLGDADVAARRVLEQREREREWERKAATRARERNAPVDDHDVRRFALDPRPTDSQALDALREFLAWRESMAATEHSGRYKAIFVMLSPPGRGKSTAGAWAVVWHRDSALYLTAAEVSSSPRTAYTDTHAVWRSWLAPDLLVVDEIGTEREPATVLSLAQERYNRGRATIVMGNLTPDGFFARYPDPRLDSRLEQQSQRGGPTMIELTSGDLRTVNP